MKIAVDIGHNCPTKDTGAVGIRREDQLTYEVGEKVIKLLEDNDHLVIRTDLQSCDSVQASLDHRIAKANLSRANIFVSIHFNAANYHAHGVEVYAVSRISRGIAREVLDQIVALGFHNRRVKKANFRVLTETSMPAILIECCFCDSKRDMNLYDADSMALAIVEGLIGDIPDEIPNELRTLRIESGTWLKSSTQQSTKLEPSQKIWLGTGKHQLLAALPEEEGHYWVRLNNEQEGFIFAGHCKIT